MSKSAFAELLDEARDRLRAMYRTSPELHFDWLPDAAQGKEWSAWYFDANDKPATFYGEAGEQALRRLVESLR